jgi:nucleoid-associated protein YgaU
MVSTAAAVVAPPAPEPAPGIPTSVPPAEDKTSSGPNQDLLVVQPGDSLWSIAKRLVGPNASPAEIARKVSRLWDLNDDRIGTGRPDLILVGTKLRLR